MLSVHRDTVHILHRMCKSGEVRRLACPLRRFPLGRPTELSGRKVVAPATKGGHFSIARKGGGLVLYKLAPNFFEGAYHGLCPLSEATQPLARAANGRRPLREYSRPADRYLSTDDSLWALTAAAPFHHSRGPPPPSGSGRRVQSKRLDSDPLRYLRSPMTKQCIKILIKEHSMNESVLP